MRTPAILVLCLPALGTLLLGRSAHATRMQKALLETLRCYIMASNPLP